MQPITNRFIFPNQAEALFTSLRQILDFVSNNMPLNADAANINFKLKVIITELLNNAIKHVGNAESILHVVIDAENIQIEKTDFGNQFNPNNLASLFDNPAQQKIQLSQDPLHCIYAVIESESFVRFICEEVNEDQIPDVNNLTEHFGLLIITKSADKFTYRYDPASGSNIFSVSLKLY